MKARIIKIGSDYKLRGHRSRVDGRKARIVTVKEIIGGRKGDVESTHPNDRFIAHDGVAEFYGLMRSDLLPL